MRKNLLALVISVSFCVLIFWWLAPLISPAPENTLPDYGDLVAYDPQRPGGHLKPGIDKLVLGERHGHAVRWITNSAGFRNIQEITPWPAEGVLRILFLGDSFVDGSRTDQGDTIGAVLQSELEHSLQQHVEVVISGHNNPANAWYFWQTHGHRVHPQLVILGMSVGNDLVSHNYGAGVWPDVKSLDHLVRVDPDISHAGIGNARLMIPADGFLAEDQRSAWQLNRVALNEALARRFYPFAHLARPAMGPLPSEPGRAQAAGYFTSLGLYYKGELPFIKSAWRDFESLLAGFVAQIRYFDARPVMVSFPSRIEALPRDWNRLVRALQLDPWKFDLDAPSRHIASLCDELELACLDSSPALRAGQENAEVFRPLGDMHLNKHGQAVTARAISNFIQILLQAGPISGPGDAWLAEYQAKVQQWRTQVLRDDAPWFDRQTGSARLSSAENLGALETIFTSGWRHDRPEDPFWGGEGVASIRIPVINTNLDHRVQLLAMPFLAQANEFRQRVVVTIGAETVLELVLDSDRFSNIPIDLPAHLLSTPWTRVKFKFPDALVPAKVGESVDQRRLAIAVIGLEINAVDP